MTMKPGDLIEAKHPFYLYQTTEDFKAGMGVVREHLHVQKGEVGFICDIEAFTYNVSEGVMDFVPFVRFSNERVGYVNRLLLKVVQEPDGQDR